jgi:hypothetical protein
MEKYKGDTYLAVDVGSAAEVYNTIRTVQSQRIAHTLNQRVLSYFKRIARTIRFLRATLVYCPSISANTRGATIEASDSIINLGVSAFSLPQVIFSFGTAPEYDP